MCLAADVAQYSRLDTPSQSAVQAELVRVLDEAAASAGLDRTAWARQPQGDQEFAVLPDGTPEALVLGPFVRHLAAGIAGLNSCRGAATRMRLRLAVDVGVVADAALGQLWEKDTSRNIERICAVTRKSATAEAWSRHISSDIAFPSPC